MKNMKYAGHVINEPFGSSDGSKMITYDNRDDIGVSYEYHSITDPSWSIEGNHIHDHWELLCFFGSEPTNILDLGATISLKLGDDNEEHQLNEATIVSIPPGLKHGDISVTDFKKPFFFLRVRTTREYEDKKPVLPNDQQLKNMLTGSSITDNGKKHWVNIIQGPFFKKREPGYIGESISAIHNEFRSGTTLGYHRIFPGYDAPSPHQHSHHELLCFIGTDPENLKDLKADVTVCLGEEEEAYEFNTATIVSVPSNLKHCPVKVRNAEKPVIFLVICTSGEKVDIF